MCFVENFDPEFVSHKSTQKIDCLTEKKKKPDLHDSTINNDILETSFATTNLSLHKNLPVQYLSWLLFLCGIFINMLTIFKKEVALATAPFKKVTLRRKQKPCIFH